MLKCQKVESLTGYRDGDGDLKQSQMEMSVKVMGLLSPPKTNGFSPENTPFRKGETSTNHQFLGSMLVFWACYLWKSQLGFHSSKFTIPKFNSSPLKSYLPNRKGSSSKHHFSRAILNFGGVLVSLFSI